MAREIGLHLRLNSSLVEVADKAIRLNIPFFQCFFVQQFTGKVMKFDEEQIKKFVALRRKYFTSLFLHGSYWINLAGIGYNGIRALRRELEVAKQLEFSHIILHPGSAKGAKNKDEGIDALARALNKELKKEDTIKFVLENTAHAKMTVGSDITDFAKLIQKLDHPEKISFCIDTCHAYSYGYDISNDKGREDFIGLLEQCIGIERIVLIHLNDTKQKLGSHIDRHEVIGEGRIGMEPLMKFINDEKLKKIPLLLELPELDEEKELALLQLLREL